MASFSTIRADAMFLRRIALLAALTLPCLCALLPAFALAADADSLIIAMPGDLPVILTAPHGGLIAPVNVPLRQTGTTVLDDHTSELAQAVAARLQQTLGARPYLVAARFSRKYIDANRAPDEAYEVAAAKPVYERYHQQIGAYLAQMNARFPQGALLIDIHGQGQDADTAFRGSKNGATFQALIQRFGADSFSGPKSIFGGLQSRGIKVFPPNTPPGNPPEDRHFNGGYTVQTWGSEHQDGVGAIQIETGRQQRNDPRFIAALADAIADFYKAYWHKP